MTNGQPLDPYEGISTDELVANAESVDVEGMLRYFCPYCDGCFDSADALYVHLEGEGCE
jgi:hypothetical protein